MMRNRLFQLRLSDEEGKRLTDLADALGLSMSAAMRYSLHRTVAIELTQIQPQNYKQHDIRSHQQAEMR
jgi:antitoxin component of RelBE/YafQ-DinJ toxin-antitoxin module